MSSSIDLFFIMRFFVGYLIGSIPSGYLIARAYGVKDIRDHGSGAIGATNVSRVLGIKFFFIVFFADFLKTYLYVMGLSQYGFAQIDLISVSVALLIGNGYSLFFRSRSGKGVATTCGVLCALAPVFLGTLFCGWLFVFFVSQTVGIASTVLYLCMPLWSYFFYDGMLLPFLFFVSIWGLILHRNNLRLYAQKMVI